MIHIIYIYRQFNTQIDSIANKMFILILSILSLKTPSSLAVKCPLLNVTTNLYEVISTSNSVYGNFSGVYKLSDDVKYPGSGKRVYEQQEKQG